MTTYAHKSAYLLDTHTIIWLIDSPETLSKTALDIILNEKNTLYFSMVSMWEIAIKVSIGKLELAPNWQTVFERELKFNQVQEIGINWQHLKKVETLPFHHKDPFDRLLIATALVEQLTFVSIDGYLEDYGVAYIW